MAFNLPAAWDPGFVLPANVRDEGLQRRGFVTKQLPRGTYDDPEAGTGGFAVPQYVRDEGYGQGTFTTKWQPSGTYNGPKVEHWLNQRPQVIREQRMPGGGRVVTVQAMGDDAPMPVIFDQYGKRAAQALLSRVAKLPAGSRETALRTIMAQVDKSLWSRTQTITKRYLAQGMPLAQAFPEALARALSTGIAAELIDTGLRRSAPQAKSLLGLGCYGPGALGFITVGPEGGGGGGPAPAPPPPQPAPAPLPVTPVLAPTAPMPAAVNVGGFTFDPRTLTRVWASSPASSTVANRTAPPDAKFVSPYDVPQEALDFLRSFLLRTGSGESMVGYIGTNPTYQYTEDDRTPWFVGLVGDPPPAMNVNALRKLRLASSPFARVKSAIDGKDMVLHISLAKRDYTKPADANTNPLELKAWLSRVPDPSVWQSIWNTLSWLPMNIAQHVIAPVVAPVITPIVTGAMDAVDAVKDAVKDGLDKLGDLACDLLKTPGVGAAAGAAGGAAAGIPPQAGAAAGQVGAQIAQGACGTPPPPPLPVPHPPSSILPLAILGGVAVVGALLLTGRGRKAS